MDAIILAAGKGTRLRPHTDTCPKPLLPVQGRPILDWIVGALPPIDRLVVVVNYLAEQVEEYLAAQKHVANWTTVRQTEPRGTGDALMSCRGAIAGDRVMVLNGDDLHLRGLIARPDGSEVIATERRGKASDAAAMGHDAGHELKRRGGPNFFD